MRERGKEEGKVRERQKETSEGQFGWNVERKADDWLDLWEGIDRRVSFARDPRSSSSRGTSKDY